MGGGVPLFFKTKMKMKKKEIERISKNYRLLLRARLSQEVLAHIATAFGLYPLNSKGKWFFEYEKLFLRLNKGQQTGFILRKLNSIANREKINNRFFIGKNNLCKEYENEAKELAKKGEGLDKETMSALINWAKWEKINQERFHRKNDEIIGLCVLLVDKHKRS